ncbi:hypothetical protein [uncultured Tateyamaria sp.]|uniref:hypothetical protein n=1 Tax=uncultured Tateyamaria sp. TaxID=455651 RepID=UPI00261DE56E|nr:hypothetical protein [uncultured Tateyamaria sp.]
MLVVIISSPRLSAVLGPRAGAVSRGLTSIAMDFRAMKALRGHGDSKNLSVTLRRNCETFDQTTRHFAQKTTFRSSSLTAAHASD